jgi:hypothetical protein
MDFLVQQVAQFLNELSAHLPQWSFTHDIASDVATLTPYLRVANTILPVDTALQILCILIGMELMLIALYWIDRLINLIRGAG